MRYAVMLLVLGGTAHADDLRVERVNLSASICRAAVVKRSMQGAIADARRAAKIGGVLNATAVRQASEVIVMVEKQERRARAELKAMKVRPYGCKDPALADVDTCSDEPSECRPDDVN